MEISIPILAAIVGSLVGGVSSLVINITSIAIQYKINNRNRRRINREQWRRETISLIRELHREALQLDLSVSEPENHTFDELVEQIENKVDRSPPQYQDSRLNSAISDIILKHNGADIDSGRFSLPEYRQDMIDSAETALENFEDYTPTVERLY